MNKVFRIFLVISIIVGLVCTSGNTIAIASIYDNNMLKIEAEDYFDRSYGTTPYATGISIQEYPSYTGETNDNIDEWLRFQPIDFKSGYTTVNISYAHPITAYSLSLEIRDSNNILYGTVDMPSTGSYSTFTTATAALSATLSGKKDLYFYLRDSGNNLAYVCVDYIQFGSPLTHSVNTGNINWTQYQTGIPNLSTLQSSNKIVIDGNGDYIIENKKFYPLQGEYAIEIKNHTTGNIVIKNCYFGGINGAAINGINPGNGKGIYVLNSSNVKIENNYFDCIQMYGVWVEATQSTQSNYICINNNRFYSMQGEVISGTSWGSTAKCVQFFNIHGIENKIWYNRCFNYPGYSYMTDFINVYTSGGTAQEYPIKVYYNEFLGGANQGLYSHYGCGIQISDHSSNNDGGQYVYGKYNRLVYPGMAGMNINGGYNNKMSYNYIYSEGQLKFINAQDQIFNADSWVGLCLYNYSGGVSRDSNHLVEGNKVSFLDSVDGGFVNVTNPSNTTISNNDFNATLYPLELLPYNFMN